jgi:predicted phage-related endonuclease
MSSLYRYHNAAAREAAKIERDTDAWHRQRGETIGASEIGQALGVSPYGGLLSLVQRKRDLRAGIIERYDNDAMADGRDAEDTILRMAARRLRAGVADSGPLQLLPGVIVLDGAISATPDGVLVDEHNVVDAVVEAKLDRGRNDWQSVADFGFADLQPGDVRLSYWWQVQQQLRVTGCARGYLAVWTVYSFHLIEILADATAAAAIDNAVAAVIAWVVDAEGRLPAASDADDISAIARTVRPAAEGPIDADEETAAALDAYVALGKQMDELEAQRDAAKRIILAGHNAGAKLCNANGIKSSFVTAGTRESVDTKRLKTEQPEIAARYLKTTTTEPTCRVTSPRAKV